jgi:dipeptidyl aminopeptidase/acylaminoacyl peptidase
MEFRFGGFMLHRLFLVSLATTILCPLAPLSSAQATPKQKHPFTFEDMMALKRVEEPEVSPDGKWVLFAAVDVDVKANTKTPHVWVVPLASGSETARPAHASPTLASVGEREIISDQDADRPRWAPDGKRFAFVSTKENGSRKFGSRILMAQRER